MQNLLASVRLPRLPSKIICWHIGDKHFWIRLFGRGVSIRNIQRLPLLFSERYGYKEYWKLGKWVLIYLPTERWHIQVNNEKND